MSLKLRKGSIQMIFRIRSRTVTTTTCSAFCLLAASLALSQTHEDFLSTEKAARTGDAGSQFILGSMYAQGRGVQQDYSEAVRWFRKAAEQGLADAQTTLGADYAAGTGVAQDYSEALRWFRKAAAQGSKGTDRIEPFIFRSKGTERSVPPLNSTPPGAVRPARSTSVWLTSPR
jgi:hypothetical protein